MIGMVNAAQNPQAMISQLMNNNPQMKPVMDAINAATLSKEEWKALERALDQISAAAAEAAG